MTIKALVRESLMRGWLDGMIDMNMDRELEEIVQKCDTCQLHNKSPPAAPLHPWEWPEKPWNRINIDYAGPLLGNRDTHHELNNVDGKSF